jgi:hypothetical protein
MDIFLAVLLFLVTSGTAYLGVHVTLHPAETANAKRNYKIVFASLTLVAVALIAWQSILNRTEQGILHTQLNRIQHNTEQPPTVQVNVPPPTIVPTTSQNVTTKPESRPSHSSSVSQKGDGNVNVDQHTEGQNSPIINSPITIGNVLKRMSPADMSTIEQFLTPAYARTKIAVEFRQSTNAGGFAEDFYNVFKSSHWPMSGDEVGSYISPSNAKGVIVRMKGEPLRPGETIQLARQDPAFYVFQVLAGYKILNDLYRDQQQPEDTITVNFQGDLP